MYIDLQLFAHKKGMGAPGTGDSNPKCSASRRMTESSFLQAASSSGRGTRASGQRRHAGTYPFAKTDGFVSLVARVVRTG